MSASTLLTAVTASLPGSVAADEVTVAPTAWSRSDDVAAVVWTGPDGLRLEGRVTTFPGLDAVWWRPTLTNAGDQPSALLSDLHPLDVVLPWSADVPARASGIEGSLCQLDDFLPWERVLDAEPVHLEPTGGRSSDGTMPFFALTDDRQSLAFGVGWSGQWSADLARTSAGVSVRIGLAHARLRLAPGESITLPSILVATADGGPEEAANVLRAVLEHHLAPHRADGGPVTPLAHMTMSSFHVTHEVSEESELAAVQRTAELGLEAFWVDACWYGDTPLWAEQVGNWYVRREAFPRGLRPVSDAAHAAGLQFVLWMEPERARRGTRLPTEHPDLFLAFPDDPANLLFDLGQPQARELALELVAGYVAEFGVDIYRQDFNIRPLAAWRAADEPEREGMHEIRHVEGLYWLWDSLRARFPDLVIDNCASGGRRIDVETSTRSVPLWRSDSADVGGGAQGDDVSLANQVQVAGLSRFVPQHTGPVWAFDAYSTRSALGTGFVVYCPLPRDPADAAALQAAVAEVKRVRPALSGDFHPLLPSTLDQSSWGGFQYHRRDADFGVVAVFRRPSSAEPSVSADLCGVDPDASYRVTFAPDYEVGPETRLSGHQLRRLALTIDRAPGSLLVEYARVD